jgi:branched-chain amino acid transport system substrate-binding protein
MSYDWLFGTVQMRADNHQLIQPLFINVVIKTDGKDVKFDADHSGMGWKPERRIEGKDTVMPTTCEMERPQS